MLRSRIPAARLDAVVSVAEEVRRAVAEGRAVVALETTLVAHGFGGDQGAAVALEAERRVRAAGAVPATVGVLEGAVRVGLARDELGRFGPQSRKTGPRDLAACAVAGAVGATTVGGTLAVCRRTGLRFMGTGGIGGVHRGWTDVPDVSADLAELARAEALVACSGVKSLLDVEASAELLETLGIPVLGYRTDELPLFYAAHGGPPVSTRVESVEEAALVARAHWELGGRGVLLARPPDPELDDVAPIVEAAVGEARRRGITGGAVTPFVLSYVHAETGGRTLDVNARLVADNAALAAEVALAYARLAA